MTEATNMIDETKAKRFVAEIEKCDAELLGLKMEYAAKAKAPRDRKSDWIQQARDAGLPIEALKLELKRRDLDRKQQALVDDAEEETVDLADQIREALGDFAGTGLGGAAVKAAEGETPAKPARKRGGRKAAGAQESAAPAQSGGDALNSLVDGEAPDDRPRFLREQEAARVAENTARLKGGIKPLAN